MNFDGKVALVTGARCGIGQAIAKLLIKQGIQVIGTSRNKEGTEIISSYLGNKGIGHILDVTDIQSIDDTLFKIHKQFGTIDILINNAGMNSDQLLIKMKELEWNKIIETNLTSIFRLSKKIIRFMLKKHYGRIISIGSVVGSMGNIGQVNYAATKAGLIGFSKSLAREVAFRGITVNIVAPGFIKTNMIQNLTEKQKTNILTNIPMGRLGHVNEIANAVLFLASNEAGYITGETLHVNGGMYMI